MAKNERRNLRARSILLFLRAPIYHVFDKGVFRAGESAFVVVLGANHAEARVSAIYIDV